MEMFRKIIIASQIAAASLLAQSAVASDYTKGIIVVNESQYGKGSGSLNYLLPGEKAADWDYRVFRKENPGRELGCTSCYGAYHNGRLYVVSKLARDPGSAVTGGILTAIDGSTLEWKGQIDALDPSGKRVCGRAFLGIDATKGYVSSSNGIWVVNLETLEVKGMIDGTENPYGVDDKPVGDPTGALYFGQCGTMLAAGGKVFAAHQSKGLLVIDASTDKLITSVSMDFVADGAGIGSVVKAKDGSLWASVTQNVDGDGMMHNSLVRIMPGTLATSVISLPEGIYPPSASWASWSADTFCASAVDNMLFWTGGSTSWFANQLVFRYDIDAGEFVQLVSFEDDDDGWKVCCPSLRVNPADGNVYMTLFKDVVSTQYMVRSYDASGNRLCDYPMERGYWFAGMMLFPEAELAGVDCVVSADALPGNLKAAYSNGVLSVEIPDAVGVKAGVALVCDFAGRIVAGVDVENSRVSARMPLQPGIYMVVFRGLVSKFAVR